MPADQQLPWLKLEKLHACISVLETQASIDTESMVEGKGRGIGGWGLVERSQEKILGKNCLFPHLWPTTDLVPAPIVLPFPKGHINRIIWTFHLPLSITVECISSSFFFIAENIIEWMDHILFIHLPVDGYICCLQFWAFMNNANTKKTTTTQFLKWATNLNRHFAQEDNMVFIAQERCSISLFVRKMQIKTAMSYHVTHCRIL